MRGGFYATADLEATSLGNFGLVSSSEPYQGRAMQATSHDTEATLVAMFRNDTAPPDDDFPWLPYVYVRKDVAIIIMSSIDILG